MKINDKKAKIEPIEYEELTFGFSEENTEFYIELVMMDADFLGKIPLLILSEKESGKEILRMTLRGAIDLKALIDKFILSWVEDKEIFEKAKKTQKKEARK